MCCSVAVLQFQNRLYESQKLTLYLYINIEVFLGYGKGFMRTATLQHCNSECRVGACFSYAERPQSRRSQHCNKMRQFDQEKNQKKLANHS